MNKKQINSIIQDLGFSPSVSVLEQVCSQLAQQPPELFHRAPSLYVRAVLILMSETKASENLSQIKESLPLFKLENTIQQLQQEQKPTFVEVIAQTLTYFPHSPFIHNKIKHLKTSFWIYHRYCEVCQILAHSTDYSTRFLRVLQGYGWVAYLCLKTQLKKSQSFLFCSGLLIGILGRLWGRYLTNLSEESVLQIAKDKLLPQTRKNCELYLPHVDSMLSHNLERRVNSSVPDFKHLLEIEQNSCQFFSNMMEDLVADYQKSDQELIFDQICFINTKELKVIGGKNEEYMINSKDAKDYCLKSFRTPAKISFSSLEDEDINDQIYHFQPRQSSRIPLLAWIQNCIGQIPKKFSFQQVYKKYNKSIKYEDFLFRVRNNLSTVVMKFSPSCRSISKRQEIMENMFIFFIEKLVQIYRSQNQLSTILKEEKVLSSILCLVCNICNFCYGALKEKYLEYIKIFQLDFFDAFKPLNWFGSFIQLPSPISDHLYQLQRDLLTQSIFTTELGNQILSNTDPQIPMVQMAMSKRILHHLRYRVIQVCKQLSISQKLSGKIFNLLFLVIKNRDYLLAKFSLDKMIVCILLACLSMNQIQNICVKKLVKWACIREETFSTGTQIIDFYNEDFLDIIEDLMREFPFQINFSLTQKSEKQENKFFSGNIFTPLKKIHQILLPQTKQSIQEKQEPSSFIIVNEYKKQSSSLEDKMEVKQSEGSLYQEENQFFQKHQLPRKKVKTHHESL